jgi:hypothetical protein
MWKGKDEKKDEKKDKGKPKRRKEAGKGSKPFLKIPIA